MNTTKTYQIQTNSLSPFSIFYVCAQVVIIICALIGNLLVCLAIGINTRLRSSATNSFILSLSFSDLLTAALSMPFDLEQILTNMRWNHGEALCQVWTTVYLIAVPSSILNLLAVSVDRYKALSDPLNKFRQSPFMTRKRAGLVIAALWLYTVTIALVPVMGWTATNVSVSEGMCYFNISTLYSILNSIVNFVLPTLIMCSLYLKIYYIARRIYSVNMQGVASLDSEEGTSQKRQRKAFRRNVKAARKILIIVCTFFVCWMPFTLTSLVVNLCGNTCSNKVPPELIQFLLLLGYLNSAINPALYSLNNQKIMNTYRNLCTLVKRKRASRAGSNVTMMTHSGFRSVAGPTLRHTRYRNMEDKSEQKEIAV